MPAAQVCCACVDAGIRECTNELYTVGINQRMERAPRGRGVARCVFESLRNVACRAFESLPRLPPNPRHLLQRASVGADSDTCPDLLQTASEGETQACQGPRLPAVTRGTALSGSACKGSEVLHVPSAQTKKGSRGGFERHAASQAC